MTKFVARAGLAVALVIALLGASAPLSAAATKPPGTAPLLPGANSKEPVSIEADKLVYYDKEQKAVYSGNVIVIQGETKMTCSKMTIFMEKTPDPGQADAGRPAEPAKAADAGGPSSGSSHVKHLDAAGPVTIVSSARRVRT